MQELTPAIANRIVAFVADGRSFFTIAKFHGMPPSRQIRLWTLQDHGFRDKIAQARLQRPPRHTPPKSDDPATWGVDEDQMDFSSQHGTIIPVEVKVTGSKTKQQGLRRAPDARMFESLTPPQERAFYRIAAAAKFDATLGYKIASYVRIDSGRAGGVDEMHEAENWTDYKSWFPKCRALGLKPEIAMDVMGGKNVTESAEYRGMDRKTIKRNLEGCLNAFCAIKGW